MERKKVTLKNEVRESEKARTIQLRKKIGKESSGSKSGWERKIVN